MAALVAACQAALACASAPTTPEKTVLVGGAAQSVVLPPLNVTAVMPEELGAVSPLVEKALRSYLAEHGASLKTLAYPAARRMWRASIREARSGPRGRAADFADAARIFVAKLSQHADFDTVILSSLFVQRATIEGTTAHWDGVARPVEIETVRGESPPEDLELEGVAAAASLHAVVLDAEGNVVQEKQGGLDLLVHVRLRSGLATHTDPLTFVARPDPLADAANLREGIAEALAPFFPDLVR